MSEPHPAEDSFQAVLSTCAQSEVPDISLTNPCWIPPTTKQIRWQAFLSNAMARVWSFLHAKYKISTAKRLRVSETISLGEKRFVAIVAVGGKEFLIGGGISGMSLLAQLGSTAGLRNDSKPKFGDGGGVL